MNYTDMCKGLIGGALNGGTSGSQNVIPITGPQQQQLQQQWVYPASQPEPRWPNQMCELLAEAGRLLLEENNRLKARIAELEAPAQVPK